LLTLSQINKHDSLRSIEEQNVKFSKRLVPQRSENPFGGLSTPNKLSLILNGEPSGRNFTRVALFIHSMKSIGNLGPFDNIKDHDIF
jgi:hypothetical protein